MQRAALLRLLELVERKLSAVDARVELGGREPEDPRLLAVALSDGMRLVAVLASPPEDRDARLSELRELADNFGRNVAGEVLDGAPNSSPGDLPRRRLDDALQALAARTHATQVLIMDVQSPVLWGSSRATEEEDVNELEELGRALARAEHRGIGMDALLKIPQPDLASRLAQASLPAAQVWSLERAMQSAQAQQDPHDALRLARAVFEVRAAHRASAGERTVMHGGDPGLLARAFANIYRLVALFEGDFSELHVEAAMLQAIPTVEHLLFALPPVDPPPKAGQVMRLPTRS